MSKSNRSIDLLGAWKIPESSRARHLGSLGDVIEDMTKKVCLISLPYRTLEVLFNGLYQLAVLIGDHQVHAAWIPWYFHKYDHEGLFTSLASLKQLSREFPLSDQRNMQGQSKLFEWLWFEKTIHNIHRRFHSDGRHLFSFNQSTLFLEIAGQRSRHTISFLSEERTQAVIDCLCTSNPQQRSYKIRTSLLLCFVSKHSWCNHLCFQLFYPTHFSQGSDISRCTRHWGPSILRTCTYHWYNDLMTPATRRLFNRRLFSGCFHPSDGGGFFGY